MTTPSTSISRYTKAVRLPLMLAPRADSSTGTAAPMAMPMVMGRAISKVMAPVPASTCRIPTAALALCSTLVKARPTRIPRRGLENLVRMAMNASLSFRGATAPDMAVMPYISTAKPSRMLPRCLRVGFPFTIRSRMPTMANMPVSVAVDSRSTQPLPPEMLFRHRIHPVTLVPRIAPMMTPMACRTFIMPELTKPTTITEVAEEDWITAVTAVPSSTPLMGVPDSL